MGIRYYKPTSAGRRGASVSDFAEITDRKKRPEKSLTVRLTRKGGRNNQGKITVRHRGGGHRKLYRIIDFKRRIDNVPMTVTHVEYDPNRSARIALVEYTCPKSEKLVKAYILAPDGTEGWCDVIMNGENAEPTVGNCLPLHKIPAGDRNPQH